MTRRNTLNKNVCKKDDSSTAFASHIIVSQFFLDSAGSLPRPLVVIAPARCGKVQSQNAHGGLLLEPQLQVAQGLHPFAFMKRFLANHLVVFDCFCVMLRGVLKSSELV